MTVAARIRTVGSCEKSVAGMVNSATRASGTRMAAHYNPLTRHMLTRLVVALLAGLSVATLTVEPQDRASKAQDWPFYGGDQAGTKFSPLGDVNKANVSRLAVAWEWTNGEKALDEFGTRPE